VTSLHGVSSSRIALIIAYGACETPGFPSPEPRMRHRPIAIAYVETANRNFAAPIRSAARSPVLAPVPTRNFGGDYLLAFLTRGLACLSASLLVLRIRRLAPAIVPAV
jgi:hypothetical protein